MENVPFRVSQTKTSFHLLATWITVQQFLNVGAEALRTSPVLLPKSKHMTAYRRNQLGRCDLSYQWERLGSITFLLNSEYQVCLTIINFGLNHRPICQEEELYISFVCKITRLPSGRCSLNAFSTNVVQPVLVLDTRLILFILLRLCLLFSPDTIAAFGLSIY